MKILASKKMSLFCFILNCIFAFISIINGDFCFLLINISLALICFYNYKVS